MFAPDQIPSAPASLSGDSSLQRTADFEGSNNSQGNAFAAVASKILEDISAEIVHLSPSKAYFRVDHLNFKLVPCESIGWVSLSLPRFMGTRGIEPGKLVAAILHFNAAWPVGTVTADAENLSAHIPLFIGDERIPSRALTDGAEVLVKLARAFKSSIQ